MRRRFFAARALFAGASSPPALCFARVRRRFFASALCFALREGSPGGFVPASAALSSDDGGDPSSGPEIELEELFPRAALLRHLFLVMGGCLLVCYCPLATSAGREMARTRPIAAKDSWDFCIR